MTERQAAFPYSPERRTAVVLCGTGADGAYHAGALRALHEAGVKIDLVAGQGIGAVGAALAALDGAARLWEPGGLWRRPATGVLYGWKPALRAAAWLALILALVILLPLLVLLAGSVVQLVAFLIGMFAAGAGTAIAGVYAAWLAALFGPAGLPSLLPPLALVLLASLLLLVFAGGLYEGWHAPARRRSRGWWWRLLSAPLDADSARAAVLGALRDLLDGGATLDAPARGALGRRYAELVGEHMGHPGFRELMLVATDLDARRDLVGILVRDPYRHHLLVSRAGTPRPDVVDLGGAGRDLALELVAAAATPPLACDPHLVTFAADSYWRGETHRLCDRPASVCRLLEEVATAGVTQAIVVSAVAPAAAPHRLRAPRLDPRSRLGDAIAADTAAALRDALEAARLDAVYVIAPAHNPVGPFDLQGAYDEASDRRYALEELLDRGYEDAGRQFIEPVIGASGDTLHARAPGDRATRSGSGVA